MSINNFYLIGLLGLLFLFFSTTTVYANDFPIQRRAVYLERERTGEQSLVGTRMAEKQFSRDSNIAILPKFCIDNELVKGLDNNLASDNIFLYDSRLINVPINHQFLIHSSDEEDYFAISSSDGQCWLLPENSNEGATIKWTTEKQKAGIWKVIKSSTETFSFEFVKQNSTAKSYDSAGLVLDVKGSEDSNYNPLILWKNNNTRNQMFKLFLPEDQHFINDIISTWRYFYIRNPWSK